MKFSKKIALGLGALLVSGAVLCQTYIGYNPLTSLNLQPGLSVSAGTLPTIGSGCLATLQVGGSSVFQFTAGQTACTVTISQPIIPPATTAAAAPNGWYCVATDETTPADTLKQSAHTTTSCTITGTVVVGDKILVEINGF